MKYIGATSISAAAVLTAFYINVRRQRRINLLEKLSEFFGAFACFSELTPEDAAKTVCRLAQTRDFGALGFLMPFSTRCVDANVKAVWREETAAFRGSVLLSPDQRERLSSFADHFGMTSLTAFSDACRKYEALFAEDCRREKQRMEKKSTVTIGAGLLAAALILIVCW